MLAVDHLATCAPPSQQEGRPIVQRWCRKVSRKLLRKPRAPRVVSSEEFRIPPHVGTIACSLPFVLKPVPASLTEPAPAQWASRPRHNGLHVVAVDRAMQAGVRYTIHVDGAACAAEPVIAVLGEYATAP